MTVSLHRDLGALLFATGGAGIVDLVGGIQPAQSDADPAAGFHKLGRPAGAVDVVRITLDGADAGGAPFMHQRFTGEPQRVFDLRILFHIELSTSKAIQ